MRACPVERAEGERDVEPLAAPKRRYATRPAVNTRSGAATAMARVTPVPKRRASTSAAVGTSVMARATE